MGVLVLRARVSPKVSRDFRLSKPFETSFSFGENTGILLFFQVHIVHSYDRIVPYVGHKRLTVVTTPPKVFSTRPSVLQREYDWIERKVRPRVGYSATNRYLNSDSAVVSHTFVWSQVGFWKTFQNHSKITSLEYLPSLIFDH